MQFLFQPLTWGFLLVLLPLLIHLINLMRQKRVDWAAMEFLRKAYRKHRKWVWMKQFLLLFSRMLAIAAAVAMLAHLITQDQFASLFGGKTTHHIVLLDDSYSMGDQGNSGTSFDRAGQVLQQLAEGAMKQPSLQKFTLLRFSQATAARAATGSALQPAANTDDPNNTDAVVPDDQVTGVLGELADLNAVTVDDEFDVLLEDRRRTFGLTQFASGPEDALNLTAQLSRIAKKDKPIVYIVSDFRTKEWSSPSAAREAIARIEESGAKVNLVQCAKESTTNLGVVSVRPAEGTRAAGVPLFVDVEIKNHGPQDATQVAVSLQSVFYGNDRNVDSPAASKGEINDLPGIVIKKLAAGETVSRRVQVYFATAGQHVVQATLQPDSLETDNQNWCVVDFPNGVPVLVIDGDPQQRNAAYLNSVFQPGQRVQTGVRPDLKTAAYLRDTQPEELAKFQAVYLLDIPRLDALAQKNLEDYVANGGGVGIFLGPNAQLNFYNEWHQSATATTDTTSSTGDGTAETANGFFPLPLDRPELMPTSDTAAPDLVPTDHPVFRVLMGEGQIFTGGILIPQYVRAPLGWKPAPESSVQIAASLRDGSPLAVDRPFGDGRVFAVMTTLAPIWNNWATQPTFPVMLLETQSYLDAGRTPQPTRLVGTTYGLQLEQSRFLPTVEFLLPGKSLDKPRSISLNATPDANKGPLMRVALDNAVTAKSAKTNRAGVYEAWPRTVDGKLDVRRFAINVDAREGDLAVVDSQDLAESLATTEVELLTAEDVASAAQNDSGFSWSQILLGILAALLIGEQLLAYSASYHPGKRATAAAARVDRGAMSGGSRR